MADPEPLPAPELRDARESDFDFAYRVTETTMREYAEKTWGAWPEERVRTTLRADIASGTLQIILVAGEPAGLYRVVRHDAHLQLDQLYLLPAFQGAGTGALLLTRLLEQASAEGLPVHLRVLRVNPAKRFYERHGFVVVGSTEERFFMESGLRDPGTR